MRQSDPTKESGKESKLDVVRDALEAAWSELERAEDHHREHHEREGRAIEEDHERLRVLLLIGEALDELGVDQYQRVLIDAELGVYGCAVAGYTALAEDHPE